MKKKLIVILGLLLMVCCLFFVNNIEEISKKGKVKANISTVKIESNDIQSNKNNGLRLRTFHAFDSTPHSFGNSFVQKFVANRGQTYRVRGTIQVEKSVNYNGNPAHAGWIRFGDKIWSTPSSEEGTTLFVDDEVTFSIPSGAWFTFGTGGYDSVSAKATELITSFSNLSLVDVVTQKELLQNPELNITGNGVVSWVDSWAGAFVYDREQDGWLVDTDYLTAWEEAIQGGFIEVKGGPVTYRYKDEEGKEIDQSQTKILNIDEKHYEEPKPIDTYQHIETIGDNPIVIKKDPQQVTFVYRKNAETEKGKVTIKYQDEKGNALSADEVIEGEVHSEYNVSDYQLELDEYEYVRSMGDPLKGTYKNIPQTVYFIYKKKGKLIVKYLDETGKPITDDDVSYGKVGDSYTVENIDIEGYRYTGDNKPITGVYKENEQIVRLIYDKLGTVTFKYQNYEGIEIAKDEVYQDVVGEMYPTTKLITILGYTYSKTLEDGNPSNYGEVTSNPKTVIYIYEENYFELLQEVNNLDGGNADLVALDEELIYKLKLTSNLKGSENYYTSLTMTEIIDSSLEEPTDIKLTTTDGSIVGKITYNSLNRKITASIKRSDNIYYSENLILSYKAKVKSKLSLGTVIKEKGMVKASYTDGNISNEKESNEVESKVDKGNLIFESAPEIISFGDEVSISSKNSKYYIESKDGELSVKDLRGDGNVWSMTAKMTKLLTHENNTTLSEGIMYPYNGNIQLIGLKSEALIYEETTSSTGVITISDAWKDKIMQPFIDVKPGIARKGKYSGVIQWTLRDVPSGHKLSAEGGIINE